MRKEYSPEWFCHAADILSNMGFNESASILYRRASTVANSFDQQSDFSSKALQCEEAAGLRKSDFDDVAPPKNKKAKCSVDGCKQTAEFEVSLYDLYMDEADSFLQIDFTCPHLCVDHMVENEEKAKGERKPRGFVEYPHTNKLKAQGFCIYRPFQRTNDGPAEELRLRIEDIIESGNTDTANDTATSGRESSKARWLWDASNGKWVEND